MPALPEFYALSPEARQVLLLEAIVEQHSWHYAPMVRIAAIVTAGG